MSPHAANSLVHDLVQMAQAMEQLPVVKEELDQAKHHAELQSTHIQNLEIAILGYKQEIETLHSSIRSLEVSRDDAEFRFLEAEDRTEKALAFVRTVFGNAGALVQALDPPKPEPEVIAPVMDQREVPLPSADGKTQVEDTTTQSSVVSEPVGWQEPVASTEPVVSVQEDPSPIGDTSSDVPQSSGISGQSEPDPTVSGQSGQSSQSTTVISQPVSYPDDATGRSHTDLDQYPF
jgi:hypothetical protein